MLLFILPSCLLFAAISHAVTIPTISAAPTIAPSSVTTASATATTAATSCPYDPEFGDASCNLTAQPIYTSYENPYDTFLYPYNFVPANPTLASECSSGWETEFSEWLTTASITTDVSPSSTGYVPIPGESGVETLIYEASTTVSYLADFNFVATAPCCLNCTLTGGTVQVYAWPTPAPSPAISALVNAQNFTFISPSVYAVFQSLEATNLCGNIGPIYRSKTIAFNEDDLSTARLWTYNVTAQPGQPYLPNAFTQAEFGTIKTCGNVTSTFYQIDGGKNPAYSGAAALSSAVGADTFAYNAERLWTITYDPCAPILSVPSQLFMLNSGWVSCTQGMSAFFDPPYILSTGSGLTAVGSVTSTTRTVTASLVGSATPKSTPSPATATQTPQPLAQTPSPSSNPTSNSPTPPSHSPTPSSHSSSPVSIDTTTQSANGNPTTTVSKSPPTNSSTTNGATSLLIPTSINPPTLASPSPTLPNSPSAQSTLSLPAVITLSSTTVKTNSTSASVLQSPNLSPSSQISCSDTFVSLASNHSTLVIGGTTTRDSSAVASPITTPTSFLQVGTQILSPGDLAVTVSGSAYSLQAGGSSIFVAGSSTTQIMAVSSLFPTTAVKEYLIASSQTLIAGAAAITVSGALVSLEAGGSSVVIGGWTKTEPLREFLGVEATLVAEGAISGLGGIIQSIGGFAASTPLAGASGSASQNGTVFISAVSRAAEASILLAGFVLGSVATAFIAW